MSEDIENEEIELLRVESRVIPPSLSCPKCEGLLPSGLGQIRCKLCNSEVIVEHELTRRRWKEEKLSCPSCSTVLVCGVDNRPCTLQCSSCESIFELTAKIPKVEVDCPSCNRTIRMNKKPGSRVINCPSCTEELSINF